jgi:hypothetical protein
MQRCQLEFPNLSRADIDLLDKHASAKKFAKQKEKALLREWRKDKADL